MSALLPLETLVKELNLRKEPGLTARVFSTQVRVCRSTNYRTALVLAHFGSAPLQRRIENYRNHFTLYTNNSTVVLVRSETTLLHTDNDAVLEYDVITPIVDKCLRTSCMEDNAWVVSYDTIDYNSVKPDSFATFSLLCWGEWWYFDQGVCLSGVTVYERGTVCQNVFIYLELHRKVPQLAVAAAASALSSPSRHLLSSLIEQQQRLQQQAARFAAVPPIGTTSTDTAAAATTTAQPSPNSGWCPSFSMLATNNAAAVAAPSLSFNNNPLSTAVAATATALQPNTTSAANVVSRTHINGNDTRHVQKSKFKQIVPTYYWFEARHEELKSGDISYFIPNKKRY